MRRLRSERGQALAEAPVAIVITVISALCLLQVVAHLHCRTAVGHAAVAVARVASTSSMVAESPEALSAYADSLLQGLPSGAAFYRRGSLDVSVVGNARTNQVVATVAVDQVPLPIVGFLLAGADGKIAVRASAVAQGAERWAKHANTSSELKVGDGWDK